MILLKFLLVINAIEMSRSIKLAIDHQLPDTSLAFLTKLGTGYDLQWFTLNSLRKNTWDLWAFADLCFYTYGLDQNKSQKKLLYFWRVFWKEKSYITYSSLVSLIYTLLCGKRFSKWLVKGRSLGHMSLDFVGLWSYLCFDLIKLLWI